MIISQEVQKPGEAFLQKTLSPINLAGRIPELLHNNTAIIVYNSIEININRISQSFNI
jgi:hypothetical protein